MRGLATSLALIGGILAFNAIANSVFEVIELRYRTPDELLPVLRPLVEPEGSISATQNKLIVRATRQDLAELRKLVSQLDTAPRQLLVTVRQGNRQDNTTNAAGVAGKGRFGDVTVDVPSTVDPSLPGIGVAGSRGGVEWRGGTRESRGVNDSDQQLRVLDGREAVIHVGQAVPYTTKSIGPGGVITQHTELREVLTGFVVRPRVQGETVTLDVSPRQESLDAGGTGAISVSRLSTSISGRLGEWIDLGAVTQQASSETRGHFSRSHSESENRRQVLIRVEVLP